MAKSQLSKRICFSTSVDTETLDCAKEIVALLVNVGAKDVSYRKRETWEGFLPGYRVTYRSSEWIENTCWRVEMVERSYKR